MTTLKQTLRDRGKKYGDFKDMCNHQRAIKKAMHGRNFDNLEPYQQEALDMFATKIGRILTGDPNYDDNWKDIAGYATKVMEYLPK